MKLIKELLILHCQNIFPVNNSFLIVKFFQWFFVVDTFTYMAKTLKICWSLINSIIKLFLLDNPNCSCGEIESTDHYLFKCPKYTYQRNSIFQNLFQLLNIWTSENWLLFGSPDLDINSNIIVWTTVHSYILQNKRFW